MQPSRPGLYKGSMAYRRQGRGAGQGSSCFMVTGTGLRAVLTVAAAYTSIKQNSGREPNNPGLTAAAHTAVQHTQANMV